VRHVWMRLKLSTLRLLSGRWFVPVIVSKPVPLFANVSCTLYNFRVACCASCFMRLSLPESPPCSSPAVTEGCLSIQPGTLAVDETQGQLHEVRFAMME